MLKLSLKQLSSRALCIILLTTTFSSAQPRNAVDTLVLTNLTIIDGNGGPPIPHMTVVISARRIADIFTTGSKKIDAGATVMNLRGRYAIPGLIDSHYHFMIGLDEKGAEERRRRFALLGGVTTVRDLAGDAIALTELAKVANDGDALSPRVYFSALMAGQEFLQSDDRVTAVSHGRKLGEIPWAQPINSQTDIAKAVTDAKATGATGIKIYAELPPEIIKQITLEAHRQGLKVWSHTAVFPSRPGDAVNAGVDSISHSMDLVFEGLPKVPEKFKGAYRGLNWYDVSPDSESITTLLQNMRTRGTILDATLVVAQRTRNKQLALAESARVIPDPDRMLDWVFEVTKRAHQLGVMISTGTDMTEGLASREFPNIHKEMELLVTKCGLTPLEAITAATRNGARAIGIEDSYGTIATGKVADLVILSADPTTDIRNTTEIVHIIKAGKLLKRDATTTVRKSKRDAKAEQELINLVRSWDEALVKHDATTLERLLADEFDFVGGPGRAQYLASVKSKSPDTFVESAVSEDVKVQVYGNTAIVTGFDTIRGKNRGQAYITRWLYMDIWIRRAGRWQCVKVYSRPAS